LILSFCNDEVKYCFYGGYYGGVGRRRRGSELQ